MIELARRAQHTATFLRMAAIEIRRMAEHAPYIEVALRHVARQLETEANDLAASLTHETIATNDRVDPCCPVSENGTRQQKTSC
jgi:hypothetical protein